MKTIYRLPDRLTFLGIRGTPSPGNENNLAGYKFEGPAPTEAQVLAVREQIGLVDYLSEIIMYLVPNPDADFIEDDYYATIWRDARTMPLFSEVIANAPVRIAERAKQQAISEKEFQIDIAARQKITSIDPTGGLVVADVLSRVAVALRPGQAAMVTVYDYGKTRKAALPGMTTQQIRDYDPSKDPGFL